MQSNNFNPLPCEMLFLMLRVEISIASDKAKGAYQTREYGALLYSPTASKRNTSFKFQDCKPK